ncbi:MAG: LacI family DNA-binding transcriptional regulator [Anaerolineae bacterium]
MNAIGIITNNERHIFQRDIIQGVTDIMHYSHTVEVDSIAEDPHNPRPIQLDMDALDGVLVIANVLSRQQLQALIDSGKPVTLVSHREPRLPIAAVIQNNVEGMLTLVDHVVRDRQRRQIVFIRGDMNQHDGIQRDQVFQQGLMRYDLMTPDHYQLNGAFDPVTAANAMYDFIERGDPFDAVIAADYMMGCAVLDVLRAMGVRMPENVSVVAFGDSPDAQQMGLTVVGSDVVEIGRRAARQLLGQIDGMQMQGVTWLNTELIVRDSS